MPKSDPSNKAAIPPSNTTHATVEEFFAAYASLTQDEHALLSRIASKHLGGTRFSEPRDLIHEAIHRNANGQRRWPLSVVFEAYMAGCMRSIVSAERKRQETTLDAGRSFEEVMETSAYLVAGHVDSVEALLIEEERAEALNRVMDQARAALVGDWEAQLAIDAFVAGLDADEACDLFGIGAARYRSARRRALREIHKRIGQWRE